MDQGSQHKARYIKSDRSGQYSGTHWHRKTLLNRALRAQSPRTTIKELGLKILKSFYVEKKQIFKKVAGHRMGKVL